MIARLFAEIMKDERGLPTGKFLEVGSADKTAIIGPTKLNSIIGNFCVKNTSKSSLNNS